MTEIYSTDVRGVRRITIMGGQQTGKTTRMIDLVAGGVVCGGSPVILCRTGQEGARLRGLLLERLSELGVKNPDAAARRAVRVDGPGSMRGLDGPLYSEDFSL